MENAQDARACAPQPCLDDLAQRYADLEARLVTLEETFAHYVCFPGDKTYSKMKAIVEAVAVDQGVAVWDIYGRRRHKHLVQARFLAIWLIKLNVDVNESQIARFLSDRDHSSIGHAVISAQRAIDRSDAKFIAAVKRIGAAL